MKKTVLVLTLFLSGGGVAAAQPHEKNILSVRGGMNVSSLTVSVEGVSVSTDSRIGYCIGVSDEMLLSDRLPFYFETGLHFSSRGGKYGDSSLRPMYIQIPVLLNYHFVIRNTTTIQPFAGLYYGLGIGGKARTDEAKGDLFGTDGPLRRSDLGVRLGAGVTWNRIYMGLSYDIGCMNQLKSEAAETIGWEFGTAKPKIRNNCFTLSVGYNF